MKWIFPWFLLMLLACSKPQNSQDEDLENAFKDVRDNTIYKTVTIGTQVWMAENLNYGTMFKSIEGILSDDGVVEKYCYNDLESSCATDGGLYRWAEAMNLPSICNNTSCASLIGQGNHQGICPEGWHIPKFSEWQTLANFLGGMSLAGAKMKLNTTGIAEWDAPAMNDGNSSGFSVYPAGSLTQDGAFVYREYLAYFWEASENSELGVNNYYLNRTKALSAFQDGSKLNNYSVRCVKD